MTLIEPITSLGKNGNMSDLLFTKLYIFVLTFDPVNPRRAGDRRKPRRTGGVLTPPLGPWAT